MTRNLLKITHDQAEAKITAALVRSSRLDARQIDVAISGSKIKLTGTVSSWSDFRQAAHVAWATPGVTLVDNQLTVTPDRPIVGGQDARVVRVALRLSVDRRTVKVVAQVPGGCHFRRPST